MPICRAIILSHWSFSSGKTLSLNTTDIREKSFFSSSVAPRAVEAHKPPELALLVLSPPKPPAIPPTSLSCNGGTERRTIGRWCGSSMDGNDRNGLLSLIAAISLGIGPLRGVSHAICPRLPQSSILSFRRNQKVSFYRPVKKKGPLNWGKKIVIFSQHL